MHLKLSFIIAFLCIFASSCDSDKEPNLDFVEVIYCTPTDPARCLPLEISNTADGWIAKYIGPHAKDSIQLRPRYCLNEFGDSTITFDEYIGNKKNGSYSFGEISQEVFPNSYHEVSYRNATGKETATFFASVISKDDIFINNKDIKNSYFKIKNHRDNDPIGCGSQRRDLNLIYLLHTNPQTFVYNFQNDDEFEAISSKDGFLRIYRCYSWTGGNGMGSSFTNLTVQYKTKDRIVTLDEFSSILLRRMKDFDGAKVTFETKNGEMGRLRWKSGS